MISGHRVQQPAERQHVPDQTCEDKTQQGQQEHENTFAAQIDMRCVKRRKSLDPADIAKVADIFEPAAVLGRVR